MRRPLRFVGGVRGKSSTRIFAALALVLAALAIGIPAALAHHPVLAVWSVNCSPDGHAVVTWRLQNSETPPPGGNGRIMVIDTAVVSSGTVSGFGTNTTVAPHDANGLPVVDGTSIYPGTQGGTVTLTIVAHWVDSQGVYVASVGHPTASITATLPNSCPLPAIKLQKTAVPTSQSLGQTVTYTYQVTNTGNVPLTSVTVTDDKLGTITLGSTTLDPTHTTTGTKSHVVVIGDFPGPILNTATAKGSPPTGPQVSDTAVASVTLQSAPGIEIVKSGPALAHAGDPVKYTFDVTNKGDVPLTNVTVVDNPLGPIGNIANLAVGQTVRLEFNTIAADDVTNTVTACGIDPLAKPVCGESSHHLDVLHPAITLDKKVEGGDHKPVGSALVVHSGDLVHYVVTIKNTGDTPLTISSLTDSLETSLPTTCTPSPSAPLAVNATITCEYTANPTTDTHNVSSVIAADALGGEAGTVTASDDTFVNVIHPALTVNKTGAAQAHPGDPVTYTFTVHNTGDVPLTAVSIDDNKLGHIGTGTFSLGIGETVTRQVTSAAPADDVTNRGTACGNDPLQAQVCDHHDHRLDVIHPSITIVKTGPTEAHAGDPVVYHFAVHNTGDVTLINVVVSDDKLGTIGTIPSLAVDETNNTLSKATDAPVTDVRNVATACGADPLEKQICNTGDHILHIVNPGINVAKSAVLTAHEGDIVTYTFSVHNTGNTALTNVAVNDDVLGLIGNIPTIAAGDTVTLTKDMTVPAGAQAVHNTVTACGLDTLEKQLCNTAIHHLIVLHPALTIDKKVAGADHKPVGDALLAHQGDLLGYTVVIRNTGNTPLDITALSDTLKTGLSGTCGKGVGATLAPSEATTCVYTTPAGATDAHNVASVTGVDALGGAGGTRSAADETFVNVIHPAIKIVKSADPKTVEPAQHTTFTYVVTNTGDTTLTNVAVTDDVLGIIGTIDSLAAGESKTVTKTETIRADSPRTNIGTACGVDVLGLKVCASSKATISIVLPVTPQGRTPTSRTVVTPPHTLPHTGFRLFLWVAVAFNLLAAGLVMMRMQRRPASN